MSLWSQLWLLLGKNVTLRKRQPVTLFVEFIWPILLLLIIAFIKRASPPNIKGPCYYQPLELPNGDFLSFMKSFVCMLDYKCHDSSRLKDTTPYKNHLTPLYEIVTSGDDSYSKVSALLGNLKNALNDVNDIRNEPIILKIQNGMITLNDFLNDTTGIKKRLLAYGLDERITDAFLSSKIKIIEIYKMLNFSSRLREKNLCDPFEAYTYFRSSPYFYAQNETTIPLTSPALTTNSYLTFSNYYTMNNLDSSLNLSSIQLANMTDDELANYNLASVICKMSKRQLISDADFISKELNFSSLASYSNVIIDYFTSSNFNQTLNYLHRYFKAGQTFANDLTLLQKFSNFDEITQIIQNALKLLELIEKFDQQILFVKKLLGDFAPIFSTFNEYNQIETFVDFIISINKLLKKLDNLFTIRSLFGSTLSDIYQEYLGSDSFIHSYELMNTYVNFEKTLLLLFKMKFGDAREAICVSPKLNGIFNPDFPDYIKSNLGYQLEKYCQFDTPTPSSLAESLFSHLNFPNMIQIVRSGIKPEDTSEFLSLANKISNYNFHQINLGDTDSLLKGFNSIYAALTFVEDSLTDTSKFNLRNVYSLAKSLLKIFAPDLFTSDQWLYADIFLPMFLPTLDLKSPSSSIVSRSISDAYSSNDLNKTNESILNVKKRHSLYVDSIGKIKRALTNSSYNVDYFNLTNTTILNSANIQTATTSVYYDYYDLTTHFLKLLSNKSHSRRLVQSKTADQVEETDSSKSLDVSNIDFGALLSGLGDSSSSGGGGGSSLNSGLDGIFSGNSARSSANIDLASLSGLLSGLGAPKSSYNQGYDDYGVAANSKSHPLPKISNSDDEISSSTSSSSLDSNESSDSSSSSNGNLFTILNLLASFSGQSNSAANLLSSLTPFLSLLPLDKLFPNSNPQSNLGLISSLPQMINLIQSFTNFQMPPLETTDVNQALSQWKTFVTDLKSQTLNIVQILSNVGAIKPVDLRIIQTVLSSNIETISSPDVVGKVILGCQGMNIWGVVEPNQNDLRNAMSSLSLLIDITDLSLNSTLQLVYDDHKVFKCTNNPLLDYYNLTKRLNLLEEASKIKELILNQQTPESQANIPTVNCLKIDSIYQKALKIKMAFQKDTSGIIKEKFECFKNSIFLPFNTIIENMKNLVDSAATNADTITILSTQMNKFVDLVKLVSWINNLFQTDTNTNSGSNRILDDMTQLTSLFKVVPQMLNDLYNMSSSLKGMQSIQDNLSMDDLNDFQNGNKMFSLLDGLKTFKNEISIASQAINNFWQKYSNLISISSYSSILFDIQKGIESLNSLVNFFSENVNGVKINEIFTNYSRISTYLQDKYSISENDANAIGESRFYQDPQDIYDSFLDSKQIYCDSNKLRDFFMINNTNYIELNDSNIEDFWPQVSKFLCNANTSTLSVISRNLAYDFTVPSDIKEIFGSDSSIFQKLTKNSSIFTNLNTSTFQMLSANTMTKLNDLFKLFSGINTNYSAYNLPNIFGKSLCGPSFSIRLEDYGYSIKPATVQMQSSNNISYIVNRTAKILSEKRALDPPNCASLYTQMRTIGGTVIGNLLTPLLYGKILYTPQNNVTSKLMKKFNKTFEQFDQLNQVLQAFSNGLEQFDDLKKLTANLSILLENPFYQDFIQLFLLQDSNLTFSDVKTFLSTLENVTALSNDWSYISNMMNSIKNSFACFETNRFIAVDSESELEALATKLFQNATFLVGFVFQNVDSTDTELPKNFAVKIRMNVDNVPETNLIRPWLWIPGPADSLFMDLRYMRGFVQLQNVLERAIVSTIGENKIGSFSSARNDKEFPVVYLQQFPYPKYKSEDSSASYVNYFILPIVVTLMWSGNIGLAIRNLIKEKEKFIEETMRAMGLRPGVNWLAWFLSTYFAMIIVAFIVSFVLKYGSIFPESNFGLIFLSLSSFAFSAIMLSFFVGSFFTKTNLASLIGILAYFVSYLPFILVMSLKYEISFSTKFALCLSAATAFGYSSLYISWYEQQGRGLQLSHIWESPIPNDTMNFSWSIIIMILDGIIYGLLGWYVKNVFPSRYGASQPWYFLFTFKFWQSTIFGRIFCHKRQQSLNEYHKDRSFKENRRANKQKEKYIEHEPSQLPIGISIKSLCRKFNDKTVVNNLTLNFFEGQITALLGHNGAGKSTTINVLTGIYAPTSGTAHIYDRDVRYEYDQIRKYVGICPQHDILFEYMTVKEHLLFYGKLKENMGRKELKRDIENMMTKIGLNQYSNDYVSSLSGGLRRRLEVAIAFVSGSRTVILDEPTSGVDPYNRMKIWDIILEFRTGRTILLTTHYLEEADVLSDRIAIIHQGKLQCCGSSMFLKNKFGSGYILTIDKKLSSPSSASLTQSKQLIIEARTRSIEAITQFISKKITGATLTRQINNTFNFTLPYSQKANFEEFFYALEKHKNSLEIASYGISDTTLEEIFLLLTTRDENGELHTPINNSISNKVAEAVSSIPVQQNLSNSFESDRDSGVAIEMGSPDVTSSKSSPKPRYFQQILSPSFALNNSMDSLSQAQLTNFGMPIRYTKLTGKKLYLQQFGALLLKRLHHYRRNLRVLVTNIILPCIFVALSMAFTTIRPKLTNQASLEMSPSIYTPNNIFMTFDNTNNSYLRMVTNDYIRSFNSVCNSYQPNYYPDGTSAFSLSKQTLNSFLCSLVSTDKCSLIYQFLYQEEPTQSSIESSIHLTTAAINCTVEPYLIETHNDYMDTRFGGITYADNIIRDDMYTNQSKVIVWFENQAYHAMPSFLHEFYSVYSKCIQSSNGKDCALIASGGTGTSTISSNSISGNAGGSSGGSNEPSIQAPLYKIYNHPISLSDERISYDTIVQKIADIGISLTILCAYSFIPAGFVVYIVRERITQDKRLQYVCGVKPFLYWFSSFIWDFVYYLVIISITIAVIASFGLTAYTANSRNFGSLVLLLVLFGWSSLPMAYMLSRFFSDIGSAYMIVFCFTLFSGIATCVAVFLLSFLADANPSVLFTYKFLEKFSLLFPSYSLGSGLIELTKNQILSEAYAIFGVNNVYKDPFSLEMLGQKYLSLLFTGILFFLIIVIMESRVNLFPCCKPTIEPSNSSKPEDADVSQERKRIQNNEARSDILVAKNLTKRYRKATGSRVCAVNNVCFSIPWGHCFGLLGINGAGKTTTFKMITDEIKPTFGTRLFNNMKMKEFLKENIIGYCPQFDAVDEYLTGKEALYIYSKLIGLNEIHAAILTAIQRFKIQSFVDVPIIKYSGGMKRTLSVAVAMLGDPQIVLLDEPTNGMDPEMRRRVWDNILKLIKDDRSVLLTSHSMAECDALCSRLAIMVNGEFVCLGTTQHLKHRFGGGYTLQIKVNKDSALNSVIEFIETKFANCILKDKHGNKLEYIVPHKGNSLGKIFGIMESNKDDYSIGDYSVSQTTLDQVFINFAKSQRDKDSDDDDDDEMDEENEEDINESESEDFNDSSIEKNAKVVINTNENDTTTTTKTKPKVNLDNVNDLTNTNNSLANDNSTFETIKNHFNSLKKSKHIRKTSSAKSQHRKQSTRSRKSQKSVQGGVGGGGGSRSSSKKRTLSNCDANGGGGSGGGFTNLAYEIEYKNSDACDLPVQESFQDLTTSINEDGEYFSKC